MKQPTVITATEMHKKRGEILLRCFRDGEHFIIERDGIALVAIVPIGQYRQEFMSAAPRAQSHSL